MDVQKLWLSCCNILMSVPACLDMLEVDWCVCKAWFTVTPFGNLKHTVLSLLLCCASSRSSLSDLLNAWNEKLDYNIKRMSVVICFTS